MQHNATKLPGENIDIFSYAPNINKFLMYKITNDGVVLNIIPTWVIESIGQDLCKVNITLPDEDCIIFCLLNDQPVFIRVGDPAVRYIFYDKQLGQTIPYNRVDTLGNELESGNLTEYGRGLYGFIPTNEIFSIIQCKHLVSPLAVPYDVNGACGHDGLITLQRSVWQMIAIPIDANVYEGFLEQLEEQAGVPITNLVEVVNCYRGDQNKFLSFVPGVTDIESVHNFPLTYNDNGSLEIVAMWVKCKQWIHTTEDVTFRWEVNK